MVLHKAVASYSGRPRERCETYRSCDVRQQRRELGAHHPLGHLLVRHLALLHSVPVHAALVHAALVHAALAHALSHALSHATLAHARLHLLHAGRHAPHRLELPCGRVKPEKQDGIVRERF